MGIGLGQRKGPEHLALAGTVKVQVARW